MRKLFNILVLFILSLSVVILTGCEQNTTTTKKNGGNNNQISFDFDDKYFIGVQEHYYEIRKMEPSVTSEFVKDIVGLTGMKVFRLNVTLNNLFYVDINDTVKFNQSTKEQMRTIVNDLKSAGIERIIYATDTFLYPYGYKATHAICAPDPYTERDAYLRWLNVNSIAYGMMATEFPEIKYFTAGHNFKLAAGWLIDQCGLKGFQHKGAAVHKNQALILINAGNATRNDVLELSNIVREKVFAKFGINLEPEAIII